MSVLHVAEQPEHRELLIDDGKVNALSQALLDELNAQIEAAAQAARPLLILGRPGCFSAGYNLKVMQAGGDARQQLRSAGDRLTLQLLEHPAPVVIACAGHALAKAALLLLCADYRLGSRGDFRIGLNETAIGMPMPATGLALTQQRLNPVWLTRCVLNAQMLGPDQALDAGFFDELCEPQDLLAQARARIAALAQLDRTAFAETKRRQRAVLLDALRKDHSAGY